MLRFLLGAFILVGVTLGVAEETVAAPSKAARQCSDMGLYAVRTLPAVARHLYTYRTSADVVVVDFSATACVRDPLKVIVGALDAPDAPREPFFFLSSLFSEEFIATHEVIFLALATRRPTGDRVFIYVAVPRNDVFMLRER